MEKLLYPIATLARLAAAVPTPQSVPAPHITGPLRPRPCERKKERDCPTPFLTPKPCLP